MFKNYIDRLFGASGMDCLCTSVGFAGPATHQIEIEIEIDKSKSSQNLIFRIEVLVTNQCHTTSVGSGGLLPAE